MKALGETVVAVQWGPWREVGMAATKGTVSWHQTDCWGQESEQDLLLMHFLPKKSDEDSF